MKALVWHGPRDVRVDDVPEPRILDAGDAIIRVTSTAICGSDLHLYNGYIPTMQAGDILGHETMGEVIEVGDRVERVRVGDRVVIPFPVACGRCPNCRAGEWTLCRNSNPNAAAAEALYGYPAAGLFGYSHLYGGYAGGQAEYLRVPFADIGCLVVPPDLSDDKVLFLSDILPTGWYGAELAESGPGRTIAVFGAGPVGLFTIQSALLMGAERVIAIDRIPERLEMAREMGAIPIDDRDDVVEALRLLTGGRGPDGCVDAVGMEGHGGGIAGFLDRVLHVARIGTDRPTALRTAIQACRPGGTVAITGVYGGALNAFPLGAAFGKGLTLRGGQTPVHRYLRPLLSRIQEGELHPERVISHRLPLSSAPEAYRAFSDKREGLIKIVLDPAA
jgi:threonine dehydrogenase-like Zn-dependent dehydrogenase